MSRVRSKRLLASVLFIPVLALTACGQDPVSEDPVLTAIRLEPAAFTLEVGATQQLTVVGDYDDGSTAALSNASFSSSDDAVATVDATGLVTAVASGTATLTAEVGTQSATASAVVAGEVVEGAVFVDDYAEGVSFADFAGAANAVSVDAAENASLKVEVPAAGYTGGALVADTNWDLTGYNALTFWVKGSQDATLNVVGIGNDAAGAAWSAELGGLPVTTDWVQHVIPLPDPEKATAVPGLFHFAEGSDEGGYTLWFDDIRYVSLPTSEVGAPTAATVAWPAELTVAPGATAPLTADNTVSFDPPALTLTAVGFRWFDLFSGDDTVATVSPEGVVTGVSEGTVDLTAALASLDVEGALTVTVAEAPTAPEVAAPVPTQDAADVVSLFSDAYTDVAVDTWRTDWSSADLTDLDVAGDAVKQYANLDFVGVEFIASGLVDASAMDYFHVDVWTPNATTFRVKFVDLGADATYGGGDDTEHEVAFTTEGDPALVAGQWVSFDIPMGAFSGLAGRDHLGQMIFSALPTGAANVFVDNLYFYRTATPQAPTEAAPTPTDDAGAVLSLFSGPYTDTPVNTWRTEWSAATLTETTVAGDAVKQYTGLDFVGIEFTDANLIDASGYDYLHVDVWTPNATWLRVRLVDFGADGAYDGGDDTQLDGEFDGSATPALTQGEWVSLDIPLAGLPARAHLAQLLFAAQPNGTSTLFVDNIYFHN